MNYILSFKIYFIFFQPKQEMEVILGNLGQKEMAAIRPPFSTIDYKLKLIFS